MSEPMNMKRKYTITYKITCLLLILSLSALLLAGAASAAGLYTMKGISGESSRQLGETAASDAEKALEQAAGEQLFALATEKAVYIEERFREVAACVHGVAAQAKDIYENPESYPDRETALPVKGSRELAAQMIRSRRLAQPTEEQLAEVLKLGNLQDMLVQYNANNDMPSSVHLATASGWVLVADYTAANKYGEDADMPHTIEAEERQWYQLAGRAEEGQVVFTDVMEDIHGGGDCIICAEPVYHQGELVAVAGAGSYLDTVNQAVLGTTVGDTGYAFLVNADGQVMVSPKAEGETAVAGKNLDLREGENGALAAAVTKALSGESGLQQLTLDGREVYLAYAPLKELGWGFLTVMDVEEILAPARESREQILFLSGEVAKEQDAAIRTMLAAFAGIFGLCALAVILAGMWFGRRVASPIRSLTGDVAKIGGGNLDYRIQLHTGDEIEELGNAFNCMTEQIKSYIENLANATAEKERIRTELQLAARLQSDMLPEGRNPFPERKEFTLCASMTPAKEVGGDFYDFFFTDQNHLALIVADVSGKGVPAALFMVVAKTLLRSHITTPETLEKAVEESNNLLCANNKNNMFVTAWVGILDVQNGSLTYVNAGHCRPLVSRDGGEYRYLTERGGFVLAATEGMRYTQTTIRLLPGDTLFQYSDGVTEANDEQGNLYGEDRLEAFVNRHREQMPEELTASVWEDIRSLQGQAEQFDDITMLALRYNGDVRTIRIETPGLESVQEVADLVEKYLQERGFPPGDTVKMLVAVDEIYSNICRYSRAEKAAVSCLVQGGRAKITFRDNGVPYNPLEKPDPDVTETIRDRPVGGLGIYMVKKTMDIVTYEYEYTEKQNKLCIMKESSIMADSLTTL